jgi:hypothetical protein
MDKEFESELILSIKENAIDCCFLTTNEASILLNKISKKFALDFSSSFLWANRRTSFISSYENKWDLRWSQLTDSISELSDNIFLIITEDNDYPLPILRIKKNDLIKLLDDSRIFEYFITDNDLIFIVFDNHHSELLKLLPIDNTII